MKYSIASTKSLKGSVLNVAASTYITVIKDNITFPILLVNFGNSSPVPPSRGFSISLIIAAYDVSNFKVIWRVVECDLKRIASIDRKYFVGILLDWGRWKETLDICCWEHKIIVCLVVKA